MKIVYQVTDEDIRANVIKALEDIEADNPVKYPDESTRNVVIETCVDYICDAYEYNTCVDGYIPGYCGIVYDTLHDYDCLSD